MENSNLKKVLATLSMSKEIEVINPKTVKGGVACYCFRCLNGQLNQNYRKGKCKT